MNWRCLCVSALCLLNITTAAAQDAPDVAIFSFDDISCAAWTRSQGDRPARAVYGTWFRGFVSGYNFGNSANQVLLGAMPDLSGVELYVDKYCRDNPSLSFIGAVIPLVQEIREFRIPVPARKP
jgi:hypothetical protein